MAAGPLEDLELKHQDDAIPCVCMEPRDPLAPPQGPVTWIEVQDVDVEAPLAAEDDLDVTVVPLNALALSKQLKQTPGSIDPHSIVS